MLFKLNLSLEIEAKSANEAIRELVFNISEEYINNREECYDALICREILGSTYVGRNVTTPNAKSDGIKELVVSVGITDGIIFNRLDSGTTKMVILVLAPLATDSDYEMFLKRVRRVNLTELADNIKRSKNREEATKTFLEYFS